MKFSPLYFFLGSGGVGKTTCAASFALALEKQGLKTAVMTVDPARRLAQALGLEKLSKETQRVRNSHPNSYIDALWLSQENALQMLAKKYIKNSEQLQKVLTHPFFKVIENQLGGIEEYLGIEKALQLVNSKEYDVCVIDTPPSQHALDFLDSAKHLQEFFDEGVLKYFIKKPTTEQNWWQRIVGIGQGQALEAFKRVIGKNFFAELADLLIQLRPLYLSLKETARQAEELFLAPQTEYVFVSSLEKDPIEEAHFLLNEISRRYPQSQQKFLINRALPAEKIDETILISNFGQKRGSTLYSMWLKEKELKEGIQNWESFPPCAQLPRFSVRQLSLSELDFLGSEMLKLWAIQK
jgi:anion-transporting  ArsA/GET3 family ATPase